MNALFLISIIIGSSLQNISKKAYSRKSSGRAAYFFSCLTSIGALAFFLCTSKNLFFKIELLPFSICFALSYMVAIVFSTKAISCGALSLSSLILSYSLMLPTFYGLIFLKDPVDKGFIPGILLLLLSLFLIKEKSEKEKVSTKWVIFIFLAFLGNGMCSVIQKVQQIRFENEYRAEFMIFALVLVALISALISLKNEKENVKECIKVGWIFALVCGIANGLVNFLVMILNSRMQISLIFPIISSGGILLTFFVSRFFYKEHLTKPQLAGFILGTLSVIFLNL